MRRPQAFFTFCLAEAAQTHALLGIYPPCLVCLTVTAGRDSLLVHAWANVWSWRAIGHAHLVNMLTFHEYFLRWCQHHSHCIHMQPYAGLSDVLAESRRLFPMANIETSQCVRVESLLPSPCQNIPQDLVGKPRCFFFFPPLIPGSPSASVWCSQVWELQIIHRVCLAPALPVT